MGASSALSGIEAVRDDIAGSLTVFGADCLMVQGGEGGAVDGRRISRGCTMLDVS